MSAPPAPPDRFRGGFHTDVRTRAAYSEGAGPFRIVPAAVAVPADLEDLVSLVQYANLRGWALTPRGAGSGMPGGNVGPGVVVDLARFDRPLTVAPEGRATVGAAVTWHALDLNAQGLGLRVPPNPSSGAYCTLGGMVATNAAGARSVSRGSIRPWVAGIEVVTGAGEVAWLSRTRPAPPAIAAIESRLRAELSQVAELVPDRFPDTRKNSAGYAVDAYLESGDLLDLWIGSEGTLGFVTQVEIRLEPRPAEVGSLLIGLPGLDTLSDVIEILLDLEPAALELLDHSFLAIAGDRTGLPSDALEAVLLAEFERADKEAVRGAVQAATRAVERHALFVRDAVTPEEHTRLWAVRHAASPVLATLPETERSLQVIEDGCVPVRQLGRYIMGVREIAAEVGCRIVAFGHAGDGHLHVNALVDTTDPAFERRLGVLYDRVTTLVLDLGGTPSGEHGDGRLRAAAVEQLYGPELVRFFRQVKRAFDPNGVMNPGIILPAEGSRPIADLKVGPRAASIPDEIAASLRQIERTGGWGAFKAQLPVARNS